MPRSLIIGDTHSPFMHVDTIGFLSAVADKYPPDIVVHIGDVGDFHALSRYVRNPAGRSAGDERKGAVGQLKPLYKLFKRVDVCEGNHDRRLVSRGEEIGIPKDFMMPVSSLLEMPEGWHWGESWEHDGVIYEHGDPFLGEKAHIRAAEANMSSTVIGHIHFGAGINFIANRKHLIWGMNVGCLIDHKSYAFDYAKKWKAKPIIGCGIVDDGVPMFVPMPLNMRGRWSKKI